MISSNLPRHDVLSDVLRTASLGSALLTSNELVAPWGMQVGPKVRAAIHLVQRGACWLRAPHQARPQRLLAGDIVFVPNGCTHELADGPDTPARPYLQELAAQQRRRTRTGVPRGERCTLVCAQITFDHTESHPLLTVLPELVVVGADAAESNDALRALARVLMREATQPSAGAELLVPRLVDALLILIVRHWLDAHPLQRAGWLSALKDEQIGRALGLMHQRPGERWTVDRLARDVAMSRAAFARRFSALVGEPPLSYLTRWRINLAARRLRTSHDTVEQVACAVGYESAAAFGHVFRRQLGVAPGRYRARAAPAAG